MTGFETSTGVPAAWYPDPQGPPLLRWWDGSVWTPQTMDPRASVVETPAVRAVEQVAAPEPPSYVPMAGFPSTPGRRSSYVEVPRRVESAHTGAIWLLALYPLIVFAITLVIGLVTESLTGTAPQLTLGGASLVLTLILCSNDNRILKERGYRPPGWGWGLIPIVYFILRLVRVGRQSLWPFLVWLGVQVLLTVIVVLTVLPPLLAALNSGGPLSPSERAAQLTPAGMAEQLGADLTGADYEVTSVVCPPLPSMTAGSQVQCTAETPLTTMYVTVTVSPEEPATAFVVGGGRIVDK
jgi:hypothetical protein